MSLFDRPSKRDWLTGLLLGIAAGTVILGVCSRFAMAGIVVLSGGTPSFSVGGTATVILLGALSGLTGAVVLVGLQFLLPRRPIVRNAIFWAFLVLLALRGLRPIDEHRLMLFMPLILVYGLTLHLLWRRLQSGRRASQPANSGAAA